MRTVAVVFCLASDLSAVLAAGLGQTQPPQTPPQPEPVKLPEPAVPTQQQPEPPKTEEAPPAPANTAPLSTEEPPRRRQRGSQEKPAATDPKTPAEAIVPAPTPLGPALRQDSFAVGDEKPTDRPFRQRSGPSVRLGSDGPPSIRFEDEAIPENP
jgi:outer membrane biosynthesis protein TonB